MSEHQSNYRFLPNHSPIVRGIVLTCIVLYLFSFFLSLGIGTLSEGFSPSGEALYLIGATGRIPVGEGRWWTLLTAIYLHGDFLHITFNMLWLLLLAPMVERIFDRSALFVIYTFSGIFGAFVSVSAGTPLSVGASGAIFGLMGSLLYYGRRFGYLSSQMENVWKWVLIGFVYGFFTPRVDNWGHLGGLIGGVVITHLLVLYEQREDPSLMYDRLAKLLMVITGIVFALSIWYWEG